MKWFDMPLAVIRAFVAMLPRLEAEEALKTAQRVSVGTGATKNGRAVIRGWERAARGGRSRAVKPTPDQLADLGIGVHVAESAHG
jgi:hypothetical protein